jgi:hypothetical protein
MAFIYVPCSGAPLGAPCSDTISGAVLISSSGDTILVWGGTYVELITIDKPLTIKKNPDPANIFLVIIQPSSSWDTPKGIISIMGDRTDGQNPITGLADVIIEELYIKFHSGYGIYAEGETTRTKIINCTIEPIFVRANDFPTRHLPLDGITLGIWSKFGAHDFLIQGCTVYATTFVNNQSIRVWPRNAIAILRYYRR